MDEEPSSIKEHTRVPLEQNPVLQTPSASPPTAGTKARRIVVKLGTNVIMRENGKVARDLVHDLVDSIAALRGRGVECMIVSSGAVGLGMERLGLARRPTEVAEIQACAAIGQSRLMAIYDDAFDKLGCRIAQVLLTEDDFRDPGRHANLRATLRSLLAFGVIPIVNENDTVSIAELDQPTGAERLFGDNDKLSALLMTHIDADLLILLSDVDGLYDRSPAGATAANFIPVVREITDEVLAFAQGGNGNGRGGMLSKLEAARIVTEAGRTVVIANGRTPEVIDRIWAAQTSRDAGAPATGTTFLPGRCI
jgi:glutamate 5-kinase